MTRRRVQTETKVSIQVAPGLDPVEVSRAVQETITEGLEKMIGESLSAPSLEEQVAELREGFEACRVAVMSVISPPKVDGTALPRCRCGDFATQTRVLSCPINGTSRQDTCDDCGFASPLVGMRGVTLLDPIPLPEVFATEARRQNAARARVRKVPR